MKKTKRPSPEPTELHRKIAEAVESLREGEVVSYSDVAALAGRPNASRAAGTVLSGAAHLPWWRVVYSDGRLPPANPSLQAERLAEEGVTLEGFRVVAAPLGRFADPD